MKTTHNISVSMMLLVFQLCLAQQTDEKRAISEENKSILIETGINVSLPVHIELYRTHRYAVGVNFRAAKNISPKTALGVRAEYDYRFARPIPDMTGTIKGKALHSNFGLIAIKPNVQFSLRRQWFLGLESGIGYAMSDANSKIGFGFVSEYGGNLHFGSCSGVYLGKYFETRAKNNKFGLSLNLTNFLAKGHAENTLGLKFNYVFKK